MNEFKELLNKLDKASKEYYKAKKQYEKVLKIIASYDKITPDDKKRFNV